MTKYRPQKKHDPIDENVQIPAAIRAAAARSAELHQQIYAEEPSANGNEPHAQGQEPQGQPEPPAQPPQGQEPPATPQNEDWEQKYLSIKGRYDKQESTIRGLNSRIVDLERHLASKPAEPAPQPRTPDLTFKPVTQDERENFGDEFIDVATRAAAEKLVPEIASLRAEVDRLKGTVTNVAEDTEIERKRNTWRLLLGEIPNAREVNHDPKFNAWLNLPDAFSGVIRKTMLQDAFEKGDAPRVIRFFQGFLSDEAATGPARPSQPEMPQGKVPLETLAAPGRAKAPASSASQVPEEKETITHAQIAAFYLDVQKGKYRGNEDEKNRLERMIFEAQAEGRVV